MKKASIQRVDGKVVNVVLHLGNLFVCGHGRCCGKAEQGYGPDFLELYQTEWRRRKLSDIVYLTQSGCLGACSLGNVVLLIFNGQPLWFHSFNTEEQVRSLYDYIEAMAKAQQMLPIPEHLRASLLEKGKPLEASHQAMSFANASLPLGDPSYQPQTTIDHAPSSSRKKVW